MTATPSPISASTEKPCGELYPLSSANSKPKLRIVESQGQVQVHMASYSGSFPLVLSEALRSAGLGSRVLIAQFLKGGVSQGPQKAINLCGRLQWFRPNTNCYLGRSHSGQNHLSDEFVKSKMAVQEIWEVCKANLLKEAVNKIVLDEIGLAMKLGFIKEDDLIETLEQRPRSIDLILTGPFIPENVIAMADQVTELRCSR
ncbi:MULTISPECIES: cob(I)yrinic acid a,c-diamide adenosyltransferase [Prochlorococcus]|uniref:cob(I)yrinic acid a,c-diamide adenosyltransferase n=1 Tax=Prochlorococcus TaxID=1218 RepID=UPI00053378C7|nr:MULTISPECIES: cob(I)yrinic acid a,c-diamide adenosyltransferase [Prochlorococcus]KGG13120.1 Cob(I)alamin adenosyltransferase [Prochlorococcus sp. MIT 0601]